MKKQHKEADIQQCEWEYDQLFPIKVMYYFAGATEKGSVTFTVTLQLNLP